MKLLLISHGSFATGLLSSFEMIAGKNEDISAIRLTDEGIGKFSQELTDYLNEHREETIFILCDVKGGTPFNEAYRKYLANPEKIRLITGMNLPMLIEMGVMISDEANVEELFSIGVHAGQDSIEGIVESFEEEDEIDF